MGNDKMSLTEKLSHFRVVYCPFFHSENAWRKKSSSLANERR